MKTRMLHSGYDRKKHPEKRPYRYMTANEAKALIAGNHIYFIDRFDAVRIAKVNGRPKTWVTRPGDVDVPCKYGLREHFTVKYRGGILFLSPEIVVEA